MYDHYLFFHLQNISRKMTILYVFINRLVNYHYVEVHEHGRFVPYKMSGKKDVYQYKEEMS